MKGLHLSGPLIRAKTVTLALFRNRSPWFSTQETPRPLGLDEVYRLHAEDVARWVSRMGGPGMAREVEDVVQEVFLQVHRALPGFRGESSLRTWLYRVTQSIVSQRRRRERRSGGWGAAHSVSLDDIQDHVESGDPSAHELSERRQANARIYQVLDRMNEGYRTLLILFEMEELSGEEIAELTGLKLATVWVRLHRARKQFAQELAALEERHAEEGR